MPTSIDTNQVITKSDIQNNKIESSPIYNERFQKLTNELRCLVCQNQSVAESNADLAKDLRREIKLQIQDGKSDSEIKKYLFDRYGEFILYEPAFSQKTFFLWFAPIILLMLFYGWFKKIGN